MVDIIKNLLSAATVAGLIAAGLKSYISGQIAKAEKAKTARDAQETERRKIDSEYMAAMASYIFWLQRGIEKLDTSHNYFNGELRASYEKMRQAEAHLKEYTRRIVAEHEQKY